MGDGRVECGAVPGLETGEVGLARVVDSTGQFEGHVTGEVLEVKLRRSSGIGSLDAAIERAILKSSPLPKPDDPALFQRTLEIKYKPFEE